MCVDQKKGRNDFYENATHLDHTAVLVVMLLLALTTSVFASNPTDEPAAR